MPRIMPAIAFSLMLMASAADAGIPEAFADDKILAALNEQLVAEGFEIVSVRVTFLRRYKIEAHAPGIDREIVLAPGTGAILRDKQEITPLENPETGRQEQDSGTVSSRADEAGPLYAEPDSQENNTDGESKDEDEESSQSESDD